MKVIIAGSRSINDIELVKYAVLESGFDITEVVSGRARGVDTLGEIWARENNISLAYFPADWKKYGRAAGPIRNAEMAKYGEALIAIMESGSKGTANMVKNAKALGLEIFILHLPSRRVERVRRVV
jgi:hypothetical protein